MNEWQDFSEIKPKKIGEYKVKLKVVSTGYLEDFKATWIPKEEKFYSEYFPVSQNENILAWKIIDNMLPVYGADTEWHYHPRWPIQEHEEKANKETANPIMDVIPREMHVPPLEEMIKN